MDSSGYLKMATIRFFRIYGLHGGGWSMLSSILETEPFIAGNEHLKQ
jgi:hypothetical protein